MKILSVTSVVSLLAVAAASMALACAPIADAQEAAALKGRHAELSPLLDSNPFQRPIHLESSEQDNRLEGDIYARIDLPYSAVGPALKGTAHWCDILILHQNVKQCWPSGDDGDQLALSVGRKFDQPLTDAQQFQFRYEEGRASADYLQSSLHSAEGPFGTSDYRITLEIVALDDRRSFLHLSYAYTSSLTARVATRGYLATMGRDKVGFSRTGASADGSPVYVAGTRGVIERNTMRYYLAIEAYLASLTAPAPEQIEKRLNDWYSGTERYPRQLHELERHEYLDMKRKEIRRQQGLDVSSDGHSSYSS